MSPFFILAPVPVKVTRIERHADGRVDVGYLLEGNEIHFTSVDPQVLGFTGKAVAENIDPTIETAYWRDAYAEQPYYSENYQYEDYEPAYRAGWESYDPTVRSDWKDRESIAKERWESEGGAPTMTWEEARLAAEDAYGRVNERAGNKPR